MILDNPFVKVQLTVRRLSQTQIMQLPQILIKLLLKLQGIHLHFKLFIKIEQSGLNSFPFFFPASLFLIWQILLDLPVVYISDRRVLERNRGQGNTHTLFAAGALFFEVEHVVQI